MARNHFEHRASKSSSAREETAQGQDSFKNRLGTDLKDYLTDLQQHFANITDEEEAHLLVSNLLHEVQGQEAKVATDSTGSRVLETTLECMDMAQMCSLCEALTASDTIYDVATSPYGSHVLEGLLMALDKSSDQDDERFEKLVSTACRSMCGCLLDMITHKYGSFVARRLLSTVAGTTGQDQETRHKQHGQHGQQHSKHRKGGLAARLHVPSNRNTDTASAAAHPPPRYPHLLTSILEAVTPSDLTASDYQELCFNQFASPYLQALLAVLATADQQQWIQLAGRIMGGQDGTHAGEDVLCVDDERVWDMMKDRTASHVIEVVFSSCPVHFDVLYRRLMGGSLKTLTRHPTANFVVQAALAALQSEQQVCSALDELRDDLCFLLNNRRGGVVSTLMATAARFDGCQGKACSALAAALKTAREDAVVAGKQGGGKGDKAASKANKLPIVMSLLLLDSPERETGLTPLSTSRPQLSTIGCAILSTVLTYKRESCLSFVDSLSSLPDDQLRCIVSHPGGCRVVESYFTGPASTKQRAALLESLRGSYIQLAMSTSGGLFVDKCYTLSDMEGKEIIVSELAGSYNRLRSTSSGAAVCTRLQIETYEHSPDAWRRRVAAAVINKKRFDDMLSGNQGKRRHGVAASGISGHQQDRQEGKDGGGDGSSGEAVGTGGVGNGVHVDLGHAENGRMKKGKGSQERSEGEGVGDGDTGEAGASVLPSTARREHVDGKGGEVGDSRVVEGAKGTKRRKREMENSDVGISVPSGDGGGDGVGVGKAKGQKKRKKSDVRISVPSGDGGGVGKAKGQKKSKKSKGGAVDEEDGASARVLRYDAEVAAVMNVLGMSGEAYGGPAGSPWGAGGSWVEASGLVKGKRGKGKKKDKPEWDTGVDNRAKEGIKKERKRKDVDVGGSMDLSAVLSAITAAEGDVDVAERKKQKGQKSSRSAKLK